MQTPKTLIRLADAQADLSLRWAHIHCVVFVMSRLKSLFGKKNACFDIDLVLQYMSSFTKSHSNNSFLKFYQDVLILFFFFFLLEKSKKYSV